MKEEIAEIIARLSASWRNRDKASGYPSISRSEYLAIKDSRYAVYLYPRKKIVTISGSMYFKLTN